jgi:hypothetical protein
MFSFCVNGMNAAVSGAIINATQNSFFNNTSAFTVAAGGVFLTGGDNKVSPTASAGSGSTGNMITK